MSLGRFFDFCFDLGSVRDVNRTIFRFVFWPGRCPGGDFGICVLALEVSGMSEGKPTHMSTRRPDTATLPSLLGHPDP
jgi:hypothetical protein